MVDNSSNGKLPTVSSVLQGLTSQLFWRHRAELLACFCEELDAAVVKLVVAARETKQTAPASGFLKDTDCMPEHRTHCRQLCQNLAVAYPGRCRRPATKLELPASVRGPCEPPDNKITAFIVVHVSSNATNPVDADDNTRPKTTLP